MGQLPYFYTLQVCTLTIKPLENYIVRAAISKGIHTRANANMVKSDRTGAVRENKTNEERWVRKPSLWCTEAVTSVLKLLVTL